MNVEAGAGKVLSLRSLTESCQLDAPMFDDHTAEG